jgi:two-component system chemotaxis sensor kinase CheA
MQTMVADPELIKEFLDETRDLLDNLDNDLVHLESDSQNQDLLNRIFRAVHTIKGTSSFLGFDQLVELGHAAEDVLHMLRDGERIVTPVVMDILLEATDKLKVLVRQIKDKNVHTIDLTSILAELGRIKSGELIASEQEETAPLSPPSQGDDGAEEKAAQKSGPSLREKVDSKDTLNDIESSTIRVGTDRLDDLMNLVGELVLERNRLLQINREFRVSQNIGEYAEKLVDTTEKIHFITSELQLSVLKTRMVPIDRLFRKFPRLVRKIAREMHKEVELVMSGGETELDKTVIDQLGDPLVHLLRNAIDHGIESPEVRKKMGKSNIGTVQLSAVQEGNHIVVSIKDDGHGVDIEKVKQHALERKMVTSGQLQTMGKQDIIQLIFEPGFSTAETVSNISGRGVGMDVVKMNIRNLNGIIDVQSQMNMGTELILKLPLTLAVIQALMVQVSDDIYAIPLASVIETLRISLEEIKMVDRREVICHRDSVIPLFYLSRLYKIDDGGKEKRQKTGYGYVVLIGVAEKRFGLVVDKLLGQEEVVIKSLGEYLGNVSGIAGGTITGDGRVRLIVDCGTVADLV